MEDWLSFLSTCPPWLALLLVAAAAFLEYVFPPAPADLMVVAGAWFVIRGELSFGAVLAAAVAGGMAGAVLQFGLGAWLAVRPTPRWAVRLTGPKAQFEAAFRHYGYLAIAFNRALPGVRAVTFLSAGLSQLPFVWVFLVGSVAHITWMSFLLGLGVSASTFDWENIRSSFFVYRNAVFWAGGLGLVLFVGFKLWQSRPCETEDVE